MEQTQPRVIMKSLLIVDDTPFDRMCTKTIVQKLGLEPQEAASGAEALEICEKSMPDGIILDWEMKTMNGIEFLKKLRAMEKGKDVYVVMSTSNTHASYIGHAYVMGVNAYMTKPVSRDKIKEKLVEGSLLKDSEEPQGN
jgi:two-component system chemotaxis response regulator CheY